MRNIEQPFSATSVLLCTVAVRSLVNAGFVDVLEQARQHLLRAPPRLHHVPLVLHIHAFVVVEEPPIDSRSWHSVPAPSTSSVSPFTITPAATTPTSVKHADVNESPGNHTQGTAAVTPTGKVLPVRNSEKNARSHNTCLLGFQPWLLAAAREIPIPCTHRFAMRETCLLAAPTTNAQKEQA